MTALSMKASVLRDRGRLDEALVLYDAVLVRDEAVPDGRTSVAVARALLERAACLAELGRLAEAIDASRETAAHLDGSSDQQVSDVAVRARVDEAVFLGRFGDNDAALAIYEEILELPVDEHDEQLIVFVLRACVEYSMTMRNLGRPEEALACLRETIDRFEDVASPLALPWIAWGMRVYARILGELGRTRARRSRRTTSSSTLLEPGETVELREWIADALLRKGDFLRDAGDRAGRRRRLPQTCSTASRSTARATCRALAPAAGLEAARLSHTFLRFERVARAGAS